MQFVEIDRAYNLYPSGYATYHDYRVAVEDECRKAFEMINTDWLDSAIENKVMEYAVKELVLRPQTPTIRAAALILPKSAFELTEPDTEIGGIQKDMIESIAMQAVMQKERELGNDPMDVSIKNRGWDIESRDRSTGELRLIEVKGRSAAQCTITVTKNEILKALNNPDHFLLAVVRVNSEDSFDGPYYVQRPFTTEPDWHSTSVNYNLQSLIDMADTV